MLLADPGRGESGVAADLSLCRLWQMCLQHLPAMVLGQLRSSHPGYQGLCQILMMSGHSPELPTLFQQADPTLTRGGSSDRSPWWSLEKETLWQQIRKTLWEEQVLAAKHSLQAGSAQQLVHLPWPGSSTTVGLWPLTPPPLGGRPPPSPPSHQAAPTPDSPE